jgi:hypothetical protein
MHSAFSIEKMAVRNDLGKRITKSDISKTNIKIPVKEILEFL